MPVFRRRTGNFLPPAIPALLAFRPYDTITTIGKQPKALRKEAGTNAVRAKELLPPFFPDEKGHLAAAKRRKAYDEQQIAP